MMSDKFFTFVFLLYALPDRSQCLRCRRSVDDYNRQQGDCTGDLCVTNTILSTAGGPSAAPLVTYGCLTGFDMKIGCFMDSWNNTVCVCNDTDMCNKDNNNNGGKAVKTEVECHSGEVKDGQLVGGGTCKGQLCQLSYAPSLTGTKSQIIASCIYDLIPTFSTGDGCLLYPNPQGGNDTWQCRCQTNLCNSPTSFKIPTRTGSVKCGSGFSNVNDTTPGKKPDNDRTCTGDFCVLTPMGDPPVVYSKQCVSVSNGARVKSSRFKFDMGKSTADMYVCDMDMCNQDVNTATKHIGMSHEDMDRRSHVGNMEPTGRWDHTERVNQMTDKVALGNDTGSEVVATTPFPDHIDHTGHNENAGHMENIEHLGHMKRVTDKIAPGGGEERMDIVPTTPLPDHMVHVIVTDKVAPSNYTGPEVIATVPFPYQTDHTMEMMVKLPPRNDTISEVVANTPLPDHTDHMMKMIDNLAPGNDTGAEANASTAFPTANETVETGNDTGAEANAATAFPTANETVETGKEKVNDTSSENNTNGVVPLEGTGILSDTASANKTETGITVTNDTTPRVVNTTAAPTDNGTIAPVISETTKSETSGMVPAETNSTAVKQRNNLAEMNTAATKQTDHSAETNNTAAKQNDHSAETNTTAAKQKDNGTNTPKPKGSPGGASTLLSSTLMVLTISLVITRL